MLCALFEGSLLSDLFHSISDLIHAVSYVRTNDPLFSVDLQPTNMVIDKK